MKRLLLLWPVPCVLVLISTLSGCNLLGLNPADEYTYTDPSTGQPVTTTVGDAVADQIDSAGGVVSNIAGKALGVATGNPIVGVSMTALLAALIGSGSSRWRKKKPVAEAATD